MEIPPPKRRAARPAAPPGLPEALAPAQPEALAHVQGAPLPSAQRAPLPSARPASLPFAQPASTPPAQPPSLAPAQLPSLAPAQPASLTPAQPASLTSAAPGTQPSPLPLAQPAAPGAQPASPPPAGGLQRRPRRARPRLILALKLVVTAGLLVVVFGRVDLAGLAARLRGADPRWLGLATAAFALNICLGALRFAFVLRSVGVALPLRRTLFVCWSGQFFNTFLPAGVVGDALRGALVARAADPVRAISAVVLDRVAAFVALCAVVGAGLATEAGRALPAAAALGSAAAALGLPALALLAGPGAVLRLAARVGGARAARWLGGGIDSPGALGPRAAALGLAVVLHLLVVGAAAALARATDVAVPTTALLAVVPAVSITAYVPVSISGIGVRDAAFVELLGQAGVPDAAGLAISVLFLGVSWVVSLGGGIVYLAGGGRNAVLPPGPEPPDAEATPPPGPPAAATGHRGGTRAERATSRASAGPAALAAGRSALSAAALAAGRSALSAAALAAALVAAAALPWVPRARLAPLLPLLFAALLPVAFAAAARAGSEARPGLRGASCLAAAAAALVVWGGLLFASVFTIYTPLDREAFLLNGAALAAAGALFVAGRRLLVAHAALIAARLDGAPGAAALCGWLAALALAADAIVFPAGYFLLHLALWALGVLLVGVALGAAVAVRRRWRPAALSAAIAWALLLAPDGTSRSLGTRLLDARPLAIGGLISHRAFVTAIWRLLDRDGDGYAARLGGADCNDADPHAHPFAGGWRGCGGSGTTEHHPAGTGASPESAASAAPSAPPLGPAPHVVVLLTIDALRCGFGVSDAPDLRDACPELTRLGREGRLRLDAHTTATQTRFALGSLFFSDLPPFSRARATGFSLPRAFEAHGFDTHAIPTCRHAAEAPGVDAFATRDLSLIAPARAGDAVTAPLVHAAILARVERALASGGRPLFVWSHHMDPHAPYVRRAGDRIIPSPRAGFVAEIRRTDAAVGALARALAAHPRAAEIVLVVTADHGEEFGEHGLAFHGAQVYEETSRVPIVAWAAGADARRRLPSRLPASLADLGPYLLAVTTGAPFAATEAAVTWAPLTGAIALVEGTDKLIFHPAHGHFELYDLARDPDERVDLATRAPATMDRLGRRLAALAPWLPARSPFAAPRR